MSTALQIIALLLFVIGLLCLFAGYRLRQVVRPTGHVDFVDSAAEAYIPHGPLVSVAHGLAGQPHGLLRLLDTEEIVPVYVIEREAPEIIRRPLRFQMAGLCLLVKVAYDQSVPYGLLRFNDRDIPLNWTPGLAEELDYILDKMRADAARSDVLRSHQEREICQACRVRAHCDQALE